MLLKVKNLSISFSTPKGVITAVRNISFELKQGETLGVVGESGCGKSLTNLAIMGLLPNNATVTADQLEFNGIDLLKLKESRWQEIRGGEMSMIFQDPMSALNPCFTVKKQICETLKIHSKISDKEATEKAKDLLNLVGIPAPTERLRCYPHELSGGMSQRVMIAMAIACNPKLLIADEPTTALDVTIQDQILRLLKDLQEKTNMAMILVTHDLGVVAQNANYIQVMYAGEIVESAPAHSIVAEAIHPYTRGLLKSLPGTHTKFRQRLPSIEGMVPDLFSRPLGCQFAPRCELARHECHHGHPALEGDIHAWRCPFALEEART